VPDDRHGINDRRVKGHHWLEIPSGSCAKGKRCPSVPSPHQPRHPAPPITAARKRVDTFLPRPSRCLRHQAWTWRSAVPGLERKAVMWGPMIYDDGTGKRTYRARGGPNANTPASSGSDA
jgi:hypothetical protein